MRPTAPEILRGSANHLTSRLLPEMGPVWARSQAQQIAGLLGVLASECDVAADRLIRENEALRAFCERAAGAVVLGESVCAPLAEAAALPPTGDIRVSTLQERNDRLWSAVEPLIERAAWDELDWGLRTELQPLLRAYVAARRPH